jgi:eukaryotic-like serine/threonine-protein kinase
MTIERGTRLGPYEIVSALGAGGMGEVWRASDTRLDRSVAIKILPAAFAQNAQLRLRFEREAKTISQLNHPNICTLYDVGASDGVDYLVMELLEGESLADRIARGPLPLDEIFRNGQQIAQALDRAHRQGVVHRDLKPANVMLTRSGAKLLDFGLSKSMVVKPAADDLTHHKALTQEGTVLGTFQYMAPEQVAGEEADHRSDIFSLGVLLYEMATGQRAFQGQTRTSLIAAIVGSEPRPLRELQPMTPPALEHVIAKCLEKDPEHRWQSAHDIAEELRWIGEAGSQAGVAAPMAMRKKSRERVAWSMALLFALALAALIPWHLSRQREAGRTFVTDLAPPADMQFNAVGDEAGPGVISPDGELVVYSLSDGRRKQLWVRSLRTGEAKALNGTDNGMFPFWAPDSRKIGFFTFGEMKQTDLDGSAPVKVTSVSNARGGAWAGDTIIFTPSTLQVIHRVPASGGEAVAVTPMDKSLHTSHRWPSFLPDGKRFIYVATNHQDPSGSSNAIYLASIDGGEPRLILRSVSNAIVHEGRLFFSRDQNLFAQRVDDDLTPKGDPVRIAENVLYDSGIWRTAFSLARNGTLLFHSGKAAIHSRLEWLGRNGASLSPAAELDHYQDLDLSPDQQKLAVIIGDPLRELWIHDLQRNSRTKVALEANYVGAAIWSADSTTLFAQVLRPSGTFELVAKRIAGGERVLLPVTALMLAGSTTPDGKTLLLEDGQKLRKLSLDPPGKELEAMPFGTTVPFGTDVSPNGRWISYESNEGGRVDVFVASLADPTIRWQISPGGGWGARWRGDGKEIYYIDPENHLTAVSLEEAGDDLHVGSPQPLFTVSLRPLGRAYDVTADGKTFIANTIGKMPSPTIVVVRNWEQRLKK